MLFWIEIYRKNGQQILGNGNGQKLERRYNSLKTFERYSLYKEGTAVNESYKKGLIIKLVKVTSDNIYQEGKTIKTYNE